ncbi:hypothetical protein D3C80_1241780 [compost metagenome]
MRGIGLHAGSAGLSRLQTRAQGLVAVCRGAHQAVADQLIATGNQRREAFVQRHQLVVDHGSGNAHQHLADLDTIGVDRGLDEIHRRIVARSIQHLVQRPLTLALFQQRLVDRVLPVEITGQVLPLGVVVDDEQHVRVALGPTGKLRQGRHVVVPHGPRRHRGKQLSHVVGRILEILLQRCPQLRLLILQARGKACSQTLAGTGRQAVEPGAYLLAGLLEFGRKLLAVGSQTVAQIGLQGSHRAPGQRDRDQHLHQKSDTESNKDRPQQAAS